MNTVSTINCLKCLTSHPLIRGKSVTASKSHCMKKPMMIVGGSFHTLENTNSTFLQMSL